MNTLLLISLFVVFTSSTTSSEASFTENQPSFNAESSSLAIPSLEEFIGPPQMEIANQNPFCIYYTLLAAMYCEPCLQEGGYSDCLQCAYYSALIYEYACDVIIQ